MSVGFLAGDDEDARADDGAEAEPGEVPPSEAFLQGLFAFLLEGKELVGIRRAGKQAVLETWVGLFECRFVGGCVFERGFWEKGLLVPLMPIACCSQWGL